MPTLNVLLHGLFAVVEEPYRVVAATPLIPDHHDYVIQVENNGHRAHRYGRGNFELLGTTPVYHPDAARFPADRNAKFKPKDGHHIHVHATSPPAYAVFTLPLPKAISSCRCFNSPQDLVLFGADAPAITSRKFASVSVLSYDFANLADLRMSGLPGIRWAFSDGSNAFVNIVLVARGTHKSTAAVSAAFDTLMADLLPTHDIHLLQINPDPKPTDPCTNIPGVQARSFHSLLGSNQNLDADDCIGPFIDQTGG
jgi:hypothetical protein